MHPRLHTMYNFTKKNMHPRLHTIYNFTENNIHPYILYIALLTKNMHSTCHRYSQYGGAYFLIQLYICCLKDKPMQSQRDTQMSNCYEVHPDTNPGPFSHCGQEDISKRYAHLIHYEFVQETCNMSDFSLYLQEM